MGIVVKFLLRFHRYALTKSSESASEALLPLTSNGILDRINLGSFVEMGTWMKCDGKNSDVMWMGNQQVPYLSRKCSEF